jgi:hypothetical protein
MCWATGTREGCLKHVNFNNVDLMCPRRFSPRTEFVCVHSHLVSTQETAAGHRSQVHHQLGLPQHIHSRTVAALFASLASVPGSPQLFYLWGRCFPVVFFFFFLSFSPADICCCLLCSSVYASDPGTTDTKMGRLGASEHNIRLMPIKQNHHSLFHNLKYRFSHF